MSRNLDAWRDLVARCLEASVFNEPAFALNAARLIPTRAKPRFLAVWDGKSRLIGLCCLVGGWLARPAAAWMHPQATAAFPLLDRQDAPRALAALLSWIAQRSVHPALVMQGLPAEGETATLLVRDTSWRHAPIERRSRAVLRHTEAEPGIVRGDKEIRRQARRLADRGRVSVTSARLPDDVGQAVERFLAIEAAGWKGRQGTALSQSRALADFTRHMTYGLAQSGQCRVDCLAVGDQTVAASIILRSGTRAFYWKTAYDEALPSIRSSRSGRSGTFSRTSGRA